jgi:hypothetical protein
MDTSQSTSANFAQQALSYAQVLARTGRGSATAAEKDAAQYVSDRLTSLGFTDVCWQPFSGELSLWLFVAMAFGIALVGHAAYWLLHPTLGELPALLIAWLCFGASGYLVWCKFTHDTYPLSYLMPHAPSQNVITVVQPIQEIERKLVLLAHLDSHRAVFWFATDFLVKSFSYIAAAAIFSIFLAIPIYGLVALTGWAVFGWLGLIIVLLHFLAWFTGVTADLGKYSPGANDNAASVGTVLALAERLKNNPLRSTELWLVFTGCEETSGDGILAVLKEYGQQLKDALFIDFEMVGIGDGLCYLQQEGNMRPLSISPEVEAFIREVGQPHGMGLTQAPLVGGATECSILWRQGYKGVSVLARREGSTLLPEWHRLTDTPDHLEVASLERVQSLAWDLLERFDQRGLSLQPAVVK